MKIILTSDLHLTDRPLDAYRFDYLNWLGAQAKRRGVGHIFILGDLTDAKDRHTASLVTRVTLAIHQLSKVCEVVILKGNHDYIDPDIPFFGFLNHLQDVWFITHPTMVHANDFPVLCVPHQREDPDVWRDQIKSWDKKMGMLLLHQTFSGSLASNGQPMEGLSPSLLKGVRKRIYSGDIHVPQTIGNIEYVGSPYHVHFGDSFKPRTVLLDGQQAVDLHWNGPKRTTAVVTDPENLLVLGFSAGDQLKVRLDLERSQYADWGKYQQRVKAICDELGVLLCAVELNPRKSKPMASPTAHAPQIHSPEKIVTAFAKKEKLDKPTTEAGREMVKIDE